MASPPIVVGGYTLRVGTVPWPVDLVDGYPQYTPGLLDRAMASRPSTWIPHAPGNTLARNTRRHLTTRNRIAISLRNMLLIIPSNRVCILVIVYLATNLLYGIMYVINTWLIWKRFGRENAQQGPWAGFPAIRLSSHRPGVDCVSLRRIDFIQYCIRYRHHHALAMISQASTKSAQA